MAPVPIKCVLSVSSEDKQNPARNLLSPGQGGKWLCAANNRSRTSEVVVELSKRAKITALEICNFGSAFVEVLVCDPSCPDQEVTLLPVSTLMSVQESRTGRNKNKMALYTKDKLSGSATSKKWNQIKIRCIQKYNLDTQFGLRSISFFTDSRDPASGVTDRTLASSFASHPSVTTPSASTPKQETPPSDQQRHKYPSLPSSAPVVTSKFGPSLKDRAKLKAQTPNRPKSQRVARSEEDYEFSGIEKQSRLFRSCVGQKSDEKGNAVKGSNQILEKISAEKEKYRKALEPQYQRKKLLKKELPKAETMTMRDFVESYKESKSSAELTGACRKLSSHDNDYEIGEEPEVKWGWGKCGTRRKKGSCRSKHNSAWLTKRKRLGSMIEHCSDILMKAGHGTSECGTAFKYTDDEDDEDEEEEEEGGGGDDNNPKNKVSSL